MARMEELTTPRAQPPAVLPRTRPLLRRRTRDLLHKVLVVLLILPGALLFLAPFIWMLSTSFKEPKYVYLFPPQIIPDPFILDNYLKAASFAPFHIYAWNTIYITILSMAGSLLTASLCAFAFARMRFPGRDVWFLILLSTIMLPGQVTLIPQFLIFKSLGWVDTYYPLIIPGWLGGGAFNIFLLRQFISTVPLELDDAAKIDGCSPFGIYLRMILPLIKPALAAIAIFGFLGHWNDFFTPMIYLNTQTKWTLALGLNWLRRAGDLPGQMGIEIIMAASVVVMIPPLLVFFLAQKYFIQGIVFTGVKG